MKRITPILEDSRGSILILTLLILMIGSLIAIYATNTSTMETRVVHNQKAYVNTFHAADSGLDPAVSILLDTVKNRTVATYPGSIQWLPGTVVSGNNTLLDVLMDYIDDEDRGFSFASAGNAAVTSVTYEREGATVQGTGGSAEFGTGSEGTGYGSTGGVFIFYYVRPTATQTASGSSASIEALYRRIPNVGDGR